MVKITIELTEEQLEELFEESEVKYSKKKLKEILNEMDLNKEDLITNPDVLERMEEELKAILLEEIEEKYN